MTLRERILAVYRGDTPDAVPFMLDLSHWFYHRNRMPWDLSRAYEVPERELIEYHRRMGVGFYLANLASFFTTEVGVGVRAEATKGTLGGAPSITWSLETPLGEIRRTRVWEENSYSWAIRDWGVRSERDLRVLAQAMGSRRFEPRWDRYRAWVDAVGDTGVVYLPIGYSAMGLLLNLWMGVEGVMYAVQDWPDTMREVVDTINRNTLELVDLAATSPAEVVLLGDNFSSDIQPPRFFAEWSRPFYAEAIRRLHAAGKFVAVHVDGRLRGALRMIGETGADCADAVTPTPLGDLTPRQCREEAGAGFIVSGGVSPDLWLPTASEEAFRAAVLEWLALKAYDPRLIANAGDQVPPGAVESRIALMRDLVEEHGRSGRAARGSDRSSGQHEGTKTPMGTKRT